jgi:hypothetical protein
MAGYVIDKEFPEFVAVTYLGIVCEMPQWTIMEFLGSAASCLYCQLDVPKFAFTQST